MLKDKAAIIILLVLMINTLKSLLTSVVAVTLLIIFQPEMIQYNVATAATLLHYDKHTQGYFCQAIINADVSQTQRFMITSYPRLRPQ